VARVATGDTGPTGYRHYRWRAGGRGLSQLVAGLSCQRSAGCRRSTAAKTWVRDVRLEVADYSNPTLTHLSGGLLGRGWLRGVQGLRAIGEDRGSGVSEILVSVNGDRFGARNGICDRVPGSGYALRFAVCGDGLTLDAQASTTRSPFREGQNALSVCAIDFAGNRACDRRLVRVDNTPPRVAFANPSANDPELIRAHLVDATSGVASGQILYRRLGDKLWRPLETRLTSGQVRGRIDSTVEPPGEYEFMAEGRDRAGNVARTTSRANGEPMVLTFPLKSRARLDAHLVPGGARLLTVGYGEGARIAGRLRDASGAPIANQEVTVVESFAAGALIDRRIGTVRTDRDGSWTQRLRPGPSRIVRATFEGTRRYLPDHAAAGRLRVNSKASFHLSRRQVPEGRRVTFRGRVAHLGARIPPGGKLIELQVKDGPQWHTVRHVFSTRPSGRYRMRYRFARFYTSNVSYRFRIKVLREAGWPYAAPVSSRPKRLVVTVR
jgi:hypothetical protein